jgi:hypothetical protein
VGQDVSDGAALPADLSDKVVSRAYPDLGYFYIQEPTRLAGVRVNDPATAGSVVPGDTISIPAETAQMSTSDGERAIDSPLTVSAGAISAPGPTWFNTRDPGRRRVQPVYTGTH